MDRAVNHCTVALTVKRTQGHDVEPHTHWAAIRSLWAASLSAVLPETTLACPLAHWRDQWSPSAGKQPFAETHSFLERNASTATFTRAW